jgi:hypothetical protein
MTFSSFRPAWDDDLLGHFGEGRDEKIGFRERWFGFNKDAYISTRHPGQGSSNEAMSKRRNLTKP